MEEMYNKWPRHLINAVPVAGYGKRLSIFTIALEGWRRGLDLKFYRLEDPENKFKVRYTLSDGINEYNFESSKGSKITSEADAICDDKYLTKKYLRQANVPVPDGEFFSEKSTDDEIIKYVKKLGFPLVLKPTDANGGRGVFSNITSMSSFKRALNIVRNKLEFNNVIVEKHVEGEEYRVIVVDDKVVGVLNRVPANVKGDGVSSIRELVNMKNKERRNNPHLRSRRIKIDDVSIAVLEKQGYDLESVPEKGKTVNLRFTSNLSTGGDSVDLTDEVPQELKQIAINATKAIPGLITSGIDIIVNSDKEEYMVIEANTKPGLGGHLFPVIGKPRNIPKAMIDLYFPKTKNKEVSNFHFNFDPIIEILKDKTTNEVKVTPCPTGKYYAREYIVSGDIQSVNYRAWIRNQAKKRSLYGFVRNLDDGKVKVVVASQNNEKLAEFKKLCYKGPEKAIVDDIVENEYNYSLPLIFEIIRPIRRMKNLDMKQLTREKNFYLRKFTEIENSRTWKATAVVRSINANIKNAMRRFKRK